MSGLSDIDLIPKVLSVDKKVRISGIEKRRERESQQNSDNRPKARSTADRREKDSGKRDSINITV